MRAQWDSNSLVQVCYSSLLTVTPPEVPKKGTYMKKKKLAPKLRIETYRLQIDNEFRLAGRNSNENALRAVDAGEKMGKDLVGSQTRRCNDGSSRPATMIKRQSKVVAPFCAEIQKGVSHQTRSYEDDTNEHSRLRGIIENQIDESRSELALFSPSGNFVSICLANTVISVFIRCFSLLDKC